MIMSETFQELSIFLLCKLMVKILKMMETPPKQQQQQQQQENNLPIFKVAGHLHLPPTRKT